MPGDNQNKFRVNTLFSRLLNKRGDINTPSKGDTQEQILQKTENISDNVLVSVCGLLGGLLLGTSTGNGILSAKNDVMSKAKTAISNAGNGLLGNTNSIISLLNNIKTYSNTISQSFVYNGTLAKYCEQYSKHILEQQNFYTSIFPKLIDAIANGNDSAIQLSLDIKANPDIVKLTEILSGKTSVQVTNENITQMLNAIQSIYSFTQQIAQNIPNVVENFKKVTETLDMMSQGLFNETRFESTIKFINRLVEPQHGELYSIINNIVQFAKVTNSKSVVESLKSIELLFNSVSKIGELSFYRQLKAKLNIWFIKRFVVSSVVSIIETLGNAQKIIEDPKVKLSLETVSKLFNTIYLIGSVNDFSKREAWKNIQFIRFFLMNAVKSIIASLDESVKEADKSKTSMEALTALFKNIINISKFEDDSIEAAEENIADIEEFIMPSIENIINKIIGLNTVDTPAKTKALSILFNDFEKLLTKLPEIKSLFLGSIKINKINKSILPGIKDLIDGLKKDITVPTNDTNSIFIYLLNELSKYVVWITQFKESVSDADGKYISYVTHIIASAIDESYEHLAELQKNISNEIRFTTFNDSISNLIEALTKAKEKLGKSDFDNLVHSISISESAASEFITTLNAFAELDKIEKYPDSMQIVNMYDALIDAYDKIKDSGVTDINSLIDGALTVSKTTAEGIRHFRRVFDDINTISGYNANMRNFEQAIRMLAAVAQDPLGNKSNKTLDEIISTGLGINNKTFAMLNNTIYAIQRLNEIAEIINNGPIKTFATIGARSLSSMINSIQGIFSSLDAIKIDKDKVKNLTKTLHELVFTLTIAGGILLFGSLLMAAISIPNLLSFAFVLGTFTWAMIKTIKGFAKELTGNIINDSLEGLRQLIITSAALLLIGSFIGEFIDTSGLTKFIVGFYAFAFGLIIVVKALSKEIKTSLESMQGIGMIVMIAGLTLALGSFIMNYVDWGSALLFTVTFGVFIGALFYSLNKWSIKDIEISKQTAVNIATIVAICGLTLAIGSYIVKGIDWVNLITFIGGYLLTIVPLFHILSKLSKDIPLSKQTAINIAAIVAICGLTLAIGSYIVKDINWVNLALFITGYVVTLGTLIGFLYKLKDSNITDASIEAAFKVTLMVSIIGLSVALITYFTKTMNWQSILTFVAGYIAIIGITCGTLCALEKTDLIKYAEKATLEFGLLILTTGITMALISYFMKSLSIGQIGMFLLAYVGIILATCGVLNFISKRGYILNAFKSVLEFGTLILTAGITMALISYFMKSLSIGQIGMFLVAYVGIILATCGALNFISKRGFILKAFKSVLEFGTLILMAGGTLLLGSLFMKLVNPVDLIIFTVTLAGFVLGVAFAFKLSGGKGTMRRASQFAAIIKMSGIILLLGGTFLTLFPELTMGVVKFTLVLAGFILAIGLTFKIGGNQIRRAKSSIAAVIGLVFVSGSMLLFAGTLMTKHPGMLLNIGMFTLCTVALVGGLAAIAWLLSTVQTGLWTGIAAMGAITILIGLNALAFNKLVETANLINGWGGFGKFIGVVAVMMGTLALVAKGILVLAMLLGNGPVTAMAYLAIGVVIAAAGAIWVVSDAMLRSAKAIDTLSKVKPINKNSLTSNIHAIVAVARALMPITTMAVPLMLASKACETMAHMLSKVAESVKNYASLKIPVYSGLKITGYRQLSDSDFKAAARNVKTIITVLGTAVIKTYEKNPEIFNVDLLGRSKFSKVCKSLEKLAPLISHIARSVKDYADMKVGDDYRLKNGFLVPHKYRYLNDNDYHAAARNINHIISTLGESVIKAYEAHPEYFETNWVGNSTFSKVCKALGKLGPLISNIAEGVKDYADMKVGSDYKFNKHGYLVPSKYRHLGDKDFQNASKNVITIISTLGTAVIGAYEAHPEYFETNWVGNSTFSKVCKALGKLGPLISNIAEGVKDYADMRIATKFKFNKNGYLVPSEYRNLTDKDFKSARKNIKNIISFMATALEEVATDGGKLKTFWADPWRGKSPITRVIKIASSIGSLISNIAKGVQDYANMKVGIDYKVNKQGVLVPTNYRNLTPADYKNAKKNISDIITTVVGALDAVYKDNKTVFDLSWVHNGFASVIGTGTPPIYKVIYVSKQIAKIISEISNSVLKMAQGRIETDWDPKTGKPIKWEQLSNKHFTAASDNIALIITNLGESIITAYKNNPEYFEDGEDSEFARATQAISTMGTMISSIVNGIQSYANLKFPIYNNKGEITGYRTLDEDVITAAREHINSIITNLGETVIKTYNSNPDIFDDGKDSVFSQACMSIQSMGEMLSAVASGIQSYADLRFPEKYDEKGNPISYKKLTNNDFKLAGNNIAELIGVMGKTIFNIYRGKSYDGTDLFGDSKIAKQMFEMPDLWDSWVGGKTDNMFINVIRSCTAMGDMITTIAEAIQEYANLSIPEYSNGKVVGLKRMTDTDFTNAGNSIAKVISTIGLSIVSIYGGKDLTGKQIINANMAKQMFEPLKIKANAGGILGLIGITQEISGDSIFERVLKAAGTMGTVITLIAQGVRDFATLSMPTGFDGSGKPTGFKPLEKNVFTDAATNIAAVITAIGKGITEAYNDPVLQEMTKVPESLNVSLGFFSIGTSVPPNSSRLYNVLRASSLMGRVITSIAQGVRDFANVVVPSKINKTTGEVIEYTQYGKEAKEKLFKPAGENIAEIITAIGKAVSNVNSDLYNNRNSAELFKSVMNMGKMVSNIANSVWLLASGVIPDFEINGKTGKKTTTFRKLTDNDFVEAGRRIALVLTTISDAVLKVNDDFIGNSTQQSMASIGKMYGAISTVVVQLAEGVKAFATMGIPEYDKDGNLVKTTPLSDTSISTAITNIGKVLNAIITGIVNGVTSKENAIAFGISTSKEGIRSYKKIKFEETPIYPGIKIIETAATAIGDIADVMMSFSGTVIKDSTGKQITLSQTQIDKAKSNIQSILTAIPQSIADAIKGKDGQTNILTDANTNINELTTRYTSIMTIINEVFSGLSEVVTESLSTKKLSAWIEGETFDKTKLYPLLKNSIDIVSKLFKDVTITIVTDSVQKQISGIVTTLNKIVTGITSIHDSLITSKLISNDQISTLLSGDDYTKTLLYKVISNSVQIIFTAFASKKMTIVTDIVQKNISGIVTAIKEIITGISEIQKVITPEIESNISNDEKIENLKNSISSIISIPNDIVKKIQEKNNNNFDILSSGNNVINQLKTTHSEISYLISFLSKIKTILNQVEAIDENILYAKLLGSKSDKNGGIIGTYKSVIGELTKITSKNNEESSFLDNIFGDEPTDDINLFTESISKIVKLAHIAQKDGDEGYNTITEGVTKINKSIESIDKDILAQHVGIMQAYIDTLNSIDSKKLDKMTQFANSMVKLSNKMGNLDGLTKAIANKLTGALQHLSNKLEDAKKTIAAADKLQKDRHKAINESITNINAIMQQSLSVKIMQVQDLDDDKLPKNPGDTPSNTPDKEDTKTTKPPYNPIGNDNEGSKTTVTTNTGNKAQVSTVSNQSNETTKTKQPATVNTQKTLRGADANMGRIAKKIDEIYEWTQRQKS